ncbi:MAG: DUF5329 family protein [Chitinispirillaceae bacterium]
MKKLHLLILPAFLLFTGFTVQGSTPAREVETIEMLIDTVKQLEDAEFVRNGKSYNANIAVRFLKGKWRWKRKEIKSADDFIQKVATSSSSSGKPYLIRFEDGKVQKSAAFFRSLLENSQSQE